METLVVTHNKRSEVVPPVPSAHSPVDADGTQVKDAGRAHHHIQRDKDVTVDAAEEPSPADHLHGTDRLISEAQRFLLLSVTTKRHAPLSEFIHKGDKRVGKEEKLGREEMLRPTPCTENSPELPAFFFSTLI